MAAQTGLGEVGGAGCLGSNPSSTSRGMDLGTDGFIGFIVLSSSLLFTVAMRTTPTSESFRLHELLCAKRSGQHRAL